MERRRFIITTLAVTFLCGLTLATGAGIWQRNPPVVLKDGEYHLPYDRIREMRRPLE